MIIYNLTERMLHRLLMETIEEGYDKEMEERERLLDYFEGINLEHDIKRYFDSESLSQIPPMYINLVRNIISRRALVYQQAPIRYNDTYNDVIGEFDSFMKQFEQLTFLLGTEALYTHWDDNQKKLKNRPIHFFTPFFRPNEDEPFAIMYQAESQLQARTDDAQYMFWSKDTEDMEGKHFMISSKGKITSIVTDDRNPYTYGGTEQLGDYAGNLMIASSLAPTLGLTAATASPVATVAATPLLTPLASSAGAGAAAGSSIAKMHPGLFASTLLYSMW